MRHVILFASAVLILPACQTAGRGAQDQHHRAIEMTAPDSQISHAENPTVTDGDKYHVIMENDRVRVLEFQDHPGDVTHQHRHPDSVLVAMSAYTRTITFPDGTSKVRTFAIGDIVWIPAQTHSGKNTGSTDSHAMLIEMKEFKSFPPPSAEVPGAKNSAP